MKFFPTLKNFFSNRFSKLALAALAFTIAYFITIPISENSATPGIADFENTLHKKETLLNTELDSLMHLSAGKTFDEIFSARPERYNSLFHDHGIALLIYQGDSLKFWSDNSVSVENYMKDVCL